MHLVVPPGGSFRETRKIELGPRVLTIGRAEACDVRLDVPGVDQEHAKISEVALIAIGADCAVGDVPLDPGNRRLVMLGDEIQIGSVVIALEGDDPNVASSPDRAGENVALGATQPQGPCIRVVEGANFGDELVLAEETKQYVIGRAPKCDLVLEDREVSREHLKLIRRGYQVFIQDQSSTRGSWLGRAAVYSGSTVEWTRPRMLKMGATVLSLELPDEIRRTHAPPAQASAPMTPPPRTRPHVDLAASTPSPPPGSLVSTLPPTSSASNAPPRPLPDLSPGRLPAFHPDRGAQGSSPQLAEISAPRVEMRAGHAPAKKGWKKTGPVIGRGAGILLLALAGLAILGALFVVFSLLE